MAVSFLRNYQRRGLARDAALYPAPGEMVDLGGRVLHVRRQGAGASTVILEGGFGASSLSWARVDREIGEFATVYSYDRAGLGWSPYNNRPKIARDLIEEMRLAMAAVGAPIPRVVVGHSFGGMLMRMYAAMYPEEVSGVVLVDALSPEDWFPLTARKTAMLRRAAQLSARGIWLAEHGVVRYALTSLERGSRLIPRMLGFFSGASGAGVHGRVAEQIRKFPIDVRLRAKAHWSRADSYRTMCEYLADLPASCAQAQLCPDLGDMPLIVLSAEHGETGHPGRQAKLAKLSTRGDYRMIEGSGHFIMLDNPQAVIEAVRDLSIGLR